ncbi:MAG: transcriptional regulator YeiL [Agathobacter sp.]|nr:transcriptional regulator YeiL [Agathobacter sp.]
MEFIQNPIRLDSLLNQHHIPEMFQFFEEYRPHFYLIRFAKGEYVFQHEEGSQYLLFFLSGKAKIYRNLSNGKSMLVSFCNSFRVLGDLELFDMDTTPSSIQAVEPCVCISLSLRHIRSRLMKDPVFLKYIAQSLATKLVQAGNNTSINMLYPLENKLASYISLSHENGIFSENLTSLSELLGTSYRHLLRVLSSFVSKGILVRGKKGYRIVNPAALDALAVDFFLN